MNNIEESIKRIRQFADFCRQKVNDHPYLNDDIDTEQAQAWCANDIYAILDELEKLKK